MDANKPVSFHIGGSQSAGPSEAPQMTENDIRINSAVLKAFPAYETDPRAVVRVDHTGHLTKAEGLSWAKQYVSKQPLGLVQGTIQKTFNAAIAPCEEQLRDWEKAKVQGERFKEDEDYKGSNLPKVMTPKNINKVAGQLQEADAMLAGMNRVLESLTKQYVNYGPHTPEREAIDDLQETIRVARIKLEASHDMLKDLRRAISPEDREAAKAAEAEEEEAEIAAESAEFAEAIAASLAEEAAVAKEPEVMRDLTLGADRARQDLKSYLEFWGPATMGLEEAQELIEEGATLVTGILEGNITSMQDIEEMGESYEKALSAMTWYFMSLAIEKGQGHESGSFAIEDPNARLFHFINSSPATDRLSSHYPKRRLEGQEKYQRGVNVRTDPILPGGQTHLLFGQLKNPIAGQEPLLFLKIEDSDPNAASWTESFHHAVGFGKSLGRKIMGGAANELPGMYKEHIPTEIKKSFALILASVKQDANAVATIHGHMAREGFAIPEPYYEADPDFLASAFGISYMKRFVEQAIQLQINDETTLDTKGVADFNRALGQLQLDHLDKRNGREVFLTHEEAAGRLRSF